MPTYSFQMSARVAGSSVSVTTAGSSTVVASGTLDANSLFTADLPIGDYVATAAGGHYSYKSAGTVVQADPDQLSEPKAKLELLRPLPYRKRPQMTIISTFQPGHGWAGNTGTWTADTTDKILGTQSIKTTVPGTNGNCTFRRLGMTALNTTDKGLAILVKVDQPTKMKQIVLYLGTGSLASFRVVGAGTGGINANSVVHANEWTWLYFSAQDLGAGTTDMTAITDIQIRVEDNNTGPFTFWVNAIAHYKRQTLYPNGVVSLAFDDNYQDVITNALPTMDKYGWGGTNFTIVQALDSASNFQTHAKLQELEATHGWEVAGHAYTFNAHNNGFTTLSQAALEDELGNLRQWLKVNGHKGADLFAYPLGDENANVVQTVGNYFTIARQIVRTPLQTLHLDQPLRVRSYSMSSSDNLAAMQAVVDRAYTAGIWLIFTFHHVVTGTPSAGTEWAAADFTALMDYIAAKGMPVAPVGQVLDSTRGVV